MQQNATAALRNLTAGSEALEQRLAEAGAVEALLQAMAQHRAVQDYAAGALWNLAASSEALVQWLAEAGAVKALLQAMAQHRAVAAVQENARGAGDLAASSEALEQWLAEEAWRRCHRLGPSTVRCPPCR